MSHVVTVFETDDDRDLRLEYSGLVVEEVVEIGVDDGDYGDSRMDYDVADEDDDSGDYYGEGDECAEDCG